MIIRTLLLFFVTTLLSQNVPAGYQKTSAGVFYKIIEFRNGTSAEKGGAVEVNMMFQNAVDTFSSNGRYLAMAIPEIVNKHSIEAVLVMLTQGDSVHIQLRSDSLYKSLDSTGLPAGLLGSDLTFFAIRIGNVISRDAWWKIQEAEAQRQAEIQLEADTLLIRNYLKENNINALRTSDGVYYVKTKETKGKLLQPGDSINTFYTGRFLNGQVFDSNRERKSFPVVLGKSPLIKGWKSVLPIVKRGEKVTVYIPSGLAYGVRGAGTVIPPNAIVVFDIEILK